MKRKISKKHQAIYAPMGDLVTYRAMPTQSLQSLDPFLFINHHGLQTYPPNNNGLPFGPHPHRGFETLTYILKGDIMHWDSNGYQSIIEEGGIQWMTAGSGLIHSEISSEKFLKEGGEIEIIQLWLNLPAELKMTPPHCQGFSKNQLAYFSEDDGKVEIMLISGEWGKHEGPAQSITGLTMTGIEMKTGGSWQYAVPEHHEILFYVVRGELTVNGEAVKQHEVLTFEQDGEGLEVSASKDSYIIFGHGEPFREPIIAHGPFVMNSQQEIMQAFQDYQAGKMGVWEG